jgi:broad specificity phosphatase PhoE
VTPFVLIRHGPTLWNEEKRLQGHIDQPLSDAGREEVRRWRLPADLRGYRWLVSPLGRAVETARLLGIAEPETEPRLKEMSWGDWEGQRLPDLRETLGADMTDLENRGLDLRPPGGESPRLLQERLKPLLAEIGRDGRPTAAVCHRGVIRALFSLASGWDMLGKPPVKVKNACCHRFLIDAEGRPQVEAMNQPLKPQAPGEAKG